MAQPRPVHHATPQLADWLIFAFIIGIGGSSFAMIRGAVETVPPAVVTVGRLWVGAIFLYAVMKHAGRKFPPLIEDTGNGATLHSHWRWMISIGVIGYIAPFFLFPWAQQFVDSGLAGIYMAFMPIWTVVLAFLFAGEALGPRKIIGFALGLIGVVLLIGPGVVGLAQTTALAPQLALLAATMCYAVQAVITRNAPQIRPRVFAAGALLSAAVLSTPALFLTDPKFGEWSFVGILNVLGLGFGPTGLGAILLIIVIQRVGAGFMAAANYLTPVWAVVLGAVIFSERLELSAFLALVVILAGVAISQRNGRAKTAVAAPAPASDSAGS